MAVYPKSAPSIATVLRLIACVSLAGGLLAAVDGPPRMTFATLGSAIVGASLLFAAAKIIDLLHDIRHEAAAAADALNRRAEDDG